MANESSFKLTYATMFNPPEELHTHYAEAMDLLKDNLGKEYPMIIGGEERYAEEKIKEYSPINTEMHLATFQKGTSKDAEDAIAAAREAFPKWSRMNWDERVYLLRKTADIIDQRLFEIGAVVTLEVGKNRMESLGDVAEMAELIRYACDQMEANQGFRVPMGKDPLPGFDSTNTSVLKPYGVWVVISPFNFPAALTGGPSGAALVAGNTLVVKPASVTIWTTALLVDCMRQAKQQDQRGCLGILTDHYRANPGNCHQKVDIEGVVDPQGHQPIAGDRPASQHQCADLQTDHRPVWNANPTQNQREQHNPAGNQGHLRLNLLDQVTPETYQCIGFIFRRQLRLIMIIDAISQCSDQFSNLTLVHIAAHGQHAIKKIELCVINIFQGCNRGFQPICAIHTIQTSNFQLFFHHTIKETSIV